MRSLAGGALSPILFDIVMNILSKPIEQKIEKE